MQQKDKTPQQIEDERKELDVQEKRKNFKNKMKCIYISILLSLIGEREINMIQGKSEEFNEEIDKEMKQYLEKMFALDTVEMKLLEIIQMVNNRIEQDEPTIQSILKCDSEHNVKGLPVPPLIGPTKNKKDRPLPVWKLQKMQELGQPLTPEQQAQIKDSPPLNLQFPSQIKNGADPIAPLVYSIDGEDTATDQQNPGTSLSASQPPAVDKPLAYLPQSAQQNAPQNPPAQNPQPAPQNAPQNPPIAQSSAYILMQQGQLNCHRADQLTVSLIPNVRQLQGKYSVTIDPNVPNKIKVQGKIDVLLVHASALDQVDQQGNTVLINANNPTMNDTQGPTAAVIQRGGVQIQQESDQWLQTFKDQYPGGKLPVGGCGITSAGSIPGVKYIVHCRSPVYDEIPNDDGKRDKTMQNCLRMGVYCALNTSQQLGATSVSMSPIQTIPIELCAKNLIANIVEWVSAAEQGHMQTIKLCVSEPDAFQKFQEFFQYYAKTWSQQ